MDNDPIQYDTENYSPTRPRQQGGGLVGLLIRLGIAKDEKQANTALAVILIVCVVIGVGVWFVV